MKRQLWFTSAIGICLLWLAAFGVAQNVKVIALSSADAEQSTKLHEQLKAAQKAVDDFDAQVSHRYTATSCDALGKDCSYKDGWSGGFLYSEDWKFIVPKNPFAYTSTTSTGTLTPNGCWSITPSLTPSGYWYFSPYGPSWSWIGGTSTSTIVPNAVFDSSSTLLGTSSFPSTGALTAQ